MGTMRNQVQLLGFAGNDPEIRNTTTGKKVAHFRIATVESYKDQSGQWQNETTWHTVTCWELLAERVEQLVKKGSYLVLTGKLMYRKYTDSNNTERTVAEIRMDAFISLDRQKNEQQQDILNASGSVLSAAHAEKFGDDLPF